MLIDFQRDKLIMIPKKASTSKKKEGLQDYMPTLPRIKSFSENSTQENAK